MTIKAVVNVSNRPWKETATKRHSSMRVRTKFAKGWEFQVAERARLAIVKKTEKEMKDEKSRIKEEKKKLSIERAQLRLENEKKAEIVQVVSSNKVKRMKKRQLKQLLKR